MRRMSETSVNSTLSSATPEAVVRRAGPPELLLAAMADPMRYAVLRELADGSHPPVLALAKKLGCHPDQMGRHLQRLRKAGLVIEVRAEGTDKRSRYYQVPKEFRSTLPDGQRVLDFGSVVLRFAPTAG
jgi:DNA-binding transcriptional ArsR family regulator